MAWARTAQPVAERTAPGAQASPAQAFRRFMELTRTSDTLANTEPEEFFRLLEPFLRNPRYRGHVELITAAAHTPRALFKAGNAAVAWTRVLPFWAARVGP
jgi:hypothetical protein